MWCCQSLEDKNGGHLEACDAQLVVLYFIALRISELTKALCVCVCVSLHVCTDVISSTRRSLFIFLKTYFFPGCLVAQWVKIYLFH